MKEVLHKLVFEFAVFRGNTRGSGTWLTGVDITLQGILGVQEGKEVAHTFDISRTGYYFTELGLDAYDFWGSKYSDIDQYAQTNQTLLNKKAMIYPYYRDPVSLKVMTEPPANWTKVTDPVTWDSSTDRAAYIKKYSELYPNNGYNWSGSVTHIHHIRPLIYGGTNAFSNLIPLPANFHIYTVTPWWNSY
ncbi:HNH endonuclease signature motif containing protein [Paenibacillus thailandensis]|uniref:HNH endonuclease signature motif containing protein n=1 Tax=Paenibacillus thailandensis TaxID=393250 RepID=A0ABW5R3R7_9BACL